VLSAPAHLSPERLAERREIARVVVEAVAALPFKHRIVIILYYLHDMDTSEISELLDLPDGTVKSRLYYGRAKLRASLETAPRGAAQGGVRYASAQSPLA
jgi:RNA polymerase sigma-70 factor (ECF subfamily)